MQKAAASGEAAGVTAKVAVLVSSCDRFFDAWKPFAAFWRKHWPTDRLPWPVFLIVNRLEVRSGWLTPLTLGPDRGWSDNLRLALGRIDADYLFYLQEDYFLTAPPDVARLSGVVDRMAAEAVDLLCLRAMPAGYGAEDWTPVPGSDGGLSEIPAGSPWRGRLQAAVWRRTALLGALRAGESAWDFEAEAAERLRPLRAWTVAAGTEAAEALPYLSSAIVRGLWTPEARRLCAETGVRIEPACRGTSSGSKAACRRRRAWDRLRLPLAQWRQRWSGAVEL